MLANHNNIQTKCTQNNQHINNNIIASNDLKRTLTKCSLHREKKICNLNNEINVLCFFMRFTFCHQLLFPSSCNVYRARINVGNSLVFLLSCLFCPFFLVFFHIFVFLFVFIIVVLFLLFREMLKRIYANLHFNVGKRRDKK